MSIFNAPDTAGSRPFWWDWASCNTSDGHYVSLFFSEDPENVEAAKRICGECAAQDICYEAAVARREPCGIWGGAVFNPSKVQRARRKARLAAEAEVVDPTAA